MYYNWYTILKLKPADEREENGGSGKANLNKTAEELMSKKELSAKISQKKGSLAPVVKELKALREEIDVCFNSYSLIEK